MPDQDDNLYESEAELPLETSRLQIGDLDVEVNKNQPEVGEQRGKHELPTRYVIGGMAFVSRTVSYIVRTSFSLHLLAMVNVYDENGTLIDQPNHGPRYDWSAFDQSLLLGAFYGAYSLANAPSGLLLDRFNIGRPYIAATFLGSSLLCALTPIASAAGSIWWLFAIRVALGVLQAGGAANVHRLASRWSPRSELGRFLGALFGVNVGIIVAGTMSGPIIERFGWHGSFYWAATIGVLFVAVWWRTVHDSPALHPRIAAAERRFIEQNLPQSVQETLQEWPPFGRMLASRAFWAQLLLQFGSDWGQYFMLSGVPLFLSRVHGFTLSDTGLLSALPYIGQTVAAFGFGYVGDKMRLRCGWSLTTFRKVFCVVSHILPSLCLLSIPFVASHQAAVCIGLMILAMVFNGAATQTSLVNYHDLAPSMAASTMAITNSVVATSGFLSPLVVAAFTSERNTMEEWRHVFMTGSAVYMFGAIVFMLFGSAEDQKWNERQRTNGRMPVQDVRANNYVLG